MSVLRTGVLRVNVAMPRFRNVDRRTPMLLPPNLQDWVRPESLVHFLIEVIEEMDLSTAHVNERGSGSEQYPPSTMLALLIFCMPMASSAPAKSSAPPMTMW